MLEETEALIDLATGRNVKNKSPVQQGILAAFILLIVFSLVMIDLTPLLLKLMKDPSGYDDYLSRMQQDRLSRPLHVDVPRQPVRDFTLPQEAPVKAPGLPIARRIARDAAPPPPPDGPMKPRGTDSQE